MIVIYRKMDVKCNSLIRANSCSWFKMHLAQPTNCYRHCYRST